MLVEELDVPIVDALRNVLANLMWTSSRYHVVPSPSVFRLCSARCSHEQVVLELALQIMLLDMFRERCRHFFRIPHACELTPSY